MPDLFLTKNQVGDYICNASKVNLYLYLNNDVPYYQEGTQLNTKERNLLDQSHREVWREHQIKFVEIVGSW